MESIFCTFICYWALTQPCNIELVSFAKTFLADCSEFDFPQDFERSVHLIDPSLLVVDNIQLLCIIRLLLGILCCHLVSYRSDSR